MTTTTMTEQKLVFSRLNRAYHKIIEKYGDAFVFGVFSWDDNTRIDAIVIPTFEDICLNTPLIADRIDNIDIIDVRFIYHATRDGRPELINALYTDNYIVTPRYEHLFQNLFLSKRESIKAGIETNLPAEELKIGLMKLLRTVWNDTSNAVRFIKQLTDAEKTAMEGIIEAIGDEGTLSQAKVASAVGVSRLTMTNLIQKIQNCGVGEVNYLGPKGTYIRFLDDTILNIRGTNNL